MRSFLVEPFKIPSGSMIPTLQVGDFILVNKFTYGIRLPIINKKLVEINIPQRGDVMVFHYPENPSLDYIKRVVGLPGDKVEYRNKKLCINGDVQAQQQDGEYNYVESGLNFVHTERYNETLGEHTHADTDESRGADVCIWRRWPNFRSARNAVIMMIGALHGAGRALLHDGRQPRQQPRQPLLGFRAGQHDSRQGVHDMDEFRRFETDRLIH